MTSSCYIIFGAPGSGKSTLLSYLPRFGHCSAIDLENIGGKENYDLPEAEQHQRNKRKAFLQHLTQTDFRSPLFIGCADIDPQSFPPQSKVILLHHPNLDHYLAWVGKRDMQRPEKAGQDYEGMHGHISRFQKAGSYHFSINPFEYEGRIDEMARHVWSMIGSVV